MIRLEEIIIALRAYKIRYHINKKQNKLVVKHNGKECTFNIHKDYMKGAIVGDGIPAIIRKKLGVEL